MSPDEAAALRDIQGYTAAGRIVFPPHTRGRMRERGVMKDDVIHALLHATTCEAEPPDRWKVPSADRDGDVLTIVVTIEEGVIVVTVF